MGRGVLSSSAAADFLGCDQSTVSRLRARGVLTGIPYPQPSGQVNYGYSISELRRLKGQREKEEDGRVRRPAIESLADGSEEGV